MINNTDIKEEIEQITSSIFDNVVKIREWLHKHPELSFKEKETSKYIASILKKNNIEFSDNIGGYGIVAYIEGVNPNSRTIAFRADMDALPIQEQNTVSYKSIHDGVMHACGHDVHTAILLGSAIVLNQLKHSFQGTIKFIFQPAEEKLPGGASLMIKDGVLENPSPQKIIALHVFPEMEVGQVGFKEGKYMAACDELNVEIIGKGGHAALPEKTINPIIMASELILNTKNQVVKIKNTSPYVLDYGDFRSFGASNVIPEKAFLQGTLRTMDEDFRSQVHVILLEEAKKIASKYQAKCNFKIIKGYPALINNPIITKECRSLAVDFLGKKFVHDLPIRMASEDFSFFSQNCPSCFFRLGVSNKQKGIVHLVHTPKFDIDDEAIRIGLHLITYFGCRI